LSGVQDELKKVDRFADNCYVKTKVLNPAIAFARQRQWVTSLEVAVLLADIKSGTMKAGDLTKVVPGLNAAQRTCQIKKLVSSRMLHPIHPGPRQYIIGFGKNTLLHSVIRSLTEEGFVPAARAAPG
jgi:hypothetical protein